MIIGDGIVLGAGGETASIFVAGPSETDTVTASKDGKTVVGKWASKLNPDYVLPDGYTQLEYIESTGTQYIDTGKRYDDGVRVCTTVRYDSSSNLGFGAASSSGRQYLNVDNSEFQFGWGSGSSYALVPNILIYNKWHIVDAKLLNQNVNLDIDGATVVSGSDTITTPKLNFYLFCVNVDGSPLIQSDKRYAMCETVIYDSIGDMSAHFIPCKHDSDSAIGMYDLVSNTFFSNSGTGTFTAGAEVPKTLGDGFLIDKIKDYGTWTVTATDGTNTATQDVLVDAADVFSINMGYLYYTEQELLDMGMRISRTIGDQIKCNGRYIQRVETTPLVVCRVNYSTGYMGYAIISNAPVTESFIETQYGAISQISGDNLTAYVYGMSAAWPSSSGYSVYLNNDVVTYAFTANGSDRTIADEYIDTINHIASSILYLR